MRDGVFQKENAVANDTQSATTWQGLKGSNPRPTVLETAALPAELNPYIYMVGLHGLEPRTDRL